MEKIVSRYICVVSVVIILTLSNITQINGEKLLDNESSLNIMIIDSYDAKSRWSMSVSKTIYKEVTKLKPDDVKLDMKYEFLNSRTNFDVDYLQVFSELLNKKYKNTNMDMIFVINSEALEFVKKEVLNSESVLYHKPIIFVGVDEDQVNLSQECKKYITGIPLKNKEGKLLDMIMNIHPMTESINVILDKFSYSSAVKENILIAKELLFDELEINFIEAEYIEDVKKEIAKLDRENQVNILTGVFTSKSDGGYINPNKIVEDLKNITDNPFYTNNYEYIDNGVIGGCVNLAEDEGECAVKMMYSILEENSSCVDIGGMLTPESIFDYNEIYKYDINVFKLPNNSIILNKPKFALLLPKTLRNVVNIALIALISVMFYVIYRFMKESQKSRERKLLYEKAKEREQMKTDFIVDMSHDLRSPLNSILSTSKIMELKIKKRDYDEDYLLKKLEEINKKSHGILKIVNNLIDVSKLELGNCSLQLENRNIVEVVEDVVIASNDYALCKGIKLIFDTEEEDIVIAMDVDKIERVILNLLSNSIKFTHRGGVIVVYIKKVNDLVSISVKDNGIGIAKDKLDEIFNRFYQVQDATKRKEGSGIGLSIVKEIIDLHGGKVNVTSEINKGTTFEVMLPIYIVAKSFEQMSIKDVSQSVKVEMADIDYDEDNI